MEILESDTCIQQVESNIWIVPPTKYVLLYLGFGFLTVNVPNKAKFLVSWIITY